MDGTDIISINLSEDGKCLLRKPAQELTGTWSTVAPGKAVIKSYGEAILKMRSDHEAVYRFNGRDINLRRVIVVAPQKPTPPIQPTQQAKPKSTPTANPTRESYRLNEIP
jgi:hypothetical protein